MSIMAVKKVFKPYYLAYINLISRCLIFMEKKVRKQMKELSNMGENVSTYVLIH